MIYNLKKYGHGFGLLLKLVEIDSISVTNITCFFTYSYKYSKASIISHLGIAPVYRLLLMHLIYYMMAGTKAFQVLMTN